LKAPCKKYPAQVGPKTGQKGAGTLILNDLFETSNQTAVIDGGVKLDTSFYNIDGSQGAMSNTAAHCSSKRKS